MTSFIDLIQQRRSCRLYEEKPVTQEQIETLQKALLWAPTSKNNRPWEFVFVTNPDTLKQLSMAKPHGANFIASAPLAVVIMADPAKSDVWIEDTAVAATLLQMTAEDLGLGSCWVQIRGRQHESGELASTVVKTILHAPEQLEIASIISIGFKGKERKPNSDDMLLSERIHQDQF